MEILCKKQGNETRNCKAHEITNSKNVTLNGWGVGTLVHDKVKVVINTLILKLYATMVKWTFAQRFYAVLSSERTLQFRSFLAFNVRFRKDNVDFYNINIVFPWVSLFTRHMLVRLFGTTKHHRILSLLCRFNTIMFILMLQRMCCAI